MLLHLILVLTTALIDSPQDRAGDCTTVEACRSLALEAAGRQDYEAFHDLAWRAVRKGKPNDPELMQMLARAQSLSGRPGDSLVMLERLLALGVTTDAATNDDFKRVRALPGWADFEKRIADAATARPARPDRPAAPEPARAKEAERDRTAPPDRTASPAAAATPAEASSIPEKGSAKPIGRNAKGPGAAAAAAPEASLAGDAAEALRFATIPFTPAGLAYDRVSNRFIVGDRDASKLTVVDEASQRVANLAGAQSAGFGTIGAFEIDAKEGDLWVVTTGEQAAPVPTLHKLQLISGRVLYAVSLDASFGGAQFADIAVTPHSSVLVLDAEGQRLFVVQPKARRLELATALKAANPTSVAPESDTVAYVAHEKGILRVDLAAGKARPVTAPKNVDMSGFTRLRWHRGGLVGVQNSNDGTQRVVRLKLDASGQRITGADLLDRSLHMKDPSAASLSGDVFYYLASPSADASDVRAETSVRRVTIK